VFGATPAAVAPVALGSASGGHPASSTAGESREPEVNVAPFVSETEVRVAIRKGEKIFIGPKTIVTPAARDLGLAHDILVDTQSSAVAKY
jgi:hypothetical protein